MTNTEDGPQFEHLADKEPTELHKRFAAWLVKEVGLEDDEVDLKTVQLACSLRMEFQRSPENQAHLEERRAAAEQRVVDRANNAEARAAKKEAAEVAKAAKAEAAKAKKAADAAAKAAAPAADEDEAPTKPSRRRRGAAAPTPPPVEEEAPKPSTRRRRAKAAPVVAEPAEDFDEDDEL